MRAELTEVVETELKRFAADLNLTDAQKAQLKTALENAHTKIDEYKAKNPTATRADAIAKLKENRTELRGDSRNSLRRNNSPSGMPAWRRRRTTLANRSRNNESSSRAGAPIGGPARPDRQVPDEYDQ
jgi:phage shock protein A